MAYEISFDKYIDNPSGTGTSVVTNRGMYKQLYTTKFNAVLVREQGKIVYNVYKVEDAEDSYIIHMKIPSEVVPKFYYDVVIRLFTTDNGKKAAASLRMYSVQFYSNDPAFVYTFAHAFSKNNIFITDLSSKMSKAALDNVASVKNPKDDIGYVKSLYFAYLTMEKYNLFQRAILDSQAKPYDKSQLLKQITHADEKVKARQEAKIKIDNKNKSSNKSNLKSNNTNNEFNHKKFGKVSTVRHSKNSKITNKTKASKITSSVKKAKIT